MMLQRFILTGVIVAGCALPAQAAQPVSGAFDKELDLRYQTEMRQLKVMGPGAKEYAKELQKQYDAYRHDAKQHEVILQQTRERIAQAREAFNQYYQQLVSEGQAEGAERMKTLFEISLMGAPVVTEASPAEHAGPTPAP